MTGTRNHDGRPDHYMYTTVTAADGWYTKSTGAEYKGITQGEIQPWADYIT